MVVPTRDLRDLAIRLDPAIDEIPIVVSESAADYQIGEEIAFWVHNLDNNDNFEISAELVHKTDAAYIWVESGRDYDHDEIVASTDRFSQNSYPAEVDFFRQCLESRRRQRSTPAYSACRRSGFRHRRLLQQRRPIQPAGQSILQREGDVLHQLELAERITRL